MIKTIIIFQFIMIANLYSQLWIPQNSGTTQEVTDIFMLDINTGYASCTGGVLLKTTNSGANWVPVPGPYTGTIANVVFFNQNTGIAFSDPVYKTTNAGNNWYQVVDYPGVMHHCIIVDSVTAYGGQPFALAKTVNRGDNWSTLNNPAFITFSYYFINASTGWVGTYYPPTSTATIWKTTNGGTGWNSLFNILDSQNIEIRDIHFPALDTGYFIGKSGKSIYRTCDAGINWQETQVQNASFTDLFFLNAKTGWGVSWAGEVFKTIDAGNMWTFTSSGITGKLNVIRFRNENTGWAVGVNGAILKSTNGGVTGLTGISGTQPQKFSLRQNYPNPFNPQTKIKFDVPKTSFTKLVIYDLLGREVTILVNEELKPGTYQADWDASAFSSGVYFYKIISGDYSETKKMVLMK